MQWWEIQLECPDADADTVAIVLQEWPEVQGVFYDGYVPDAPLHPEYGEWFEEGLSEQNSTRAHVKVYLPAWLDKAAVEARVAAAIEEIGTFGVVHEAINASIQSVDDAAWSHVWNEEFQPIPIGEALAIVPTSKRDTWQDAHRVPIYLDVGRAFGTGSHATTKLCLELLEGVLESGMRVLDVGCGTGVLSIAAAKLGAATVTAVDVDPVAVRTASENVTVNGVDRVQVCQSDLLTEVAQDQYDVALGNILRDVVIRLGPAVAERLNYHGIFIASGFLEGDIKTVATALLESGLHVKESVVRDEWAAILAVKTP